MVGFIYTTLALTAASSVSALVLPRTPVPVPDQPAGWATTYLEPYAEYHTRYLAIGCQNQHGTEFFDDCCHPLLATETLEEARPEKCIPTTEDLSAASTAEPTTDDDSEVEYNSGETGDSSPPAANSLKAAGPPSDGGDQGEPQDGGDSGGKKGKSGKSSGGAPPSDGGDAPPSDGGDGGNPNNGGGNPVGDIVGDITGGFATFYEQGSQAGACGDFHTDDELVAALDFRRYGNVDAKSDTCGKRIHLTNTDNGKSVEVLVVDACPTCVNENCIDLSPAAFNQISDPVTGMVPIAWSFI